MSDCKGLIFKISNNTFWHDNKYVNKRELRLMKRLSCANCPSCEYGLELVEIAAQEGDYFPVHEVDIVDGNLYSLRFSEDECYFTRVLL